MCGLAFNYICSSPPSLQLPYAVWANMPGTCSLKGVETAILAGCRAAPGLRMRSHRGVGTRWTNRTYDPPAKSAKVASMQGDCI